MRRGQIDHNPDTDAGLIISEKPVAGLDEVSAFKIIDEANDVAEAAHLLAQAPTKRTYHNSTGVRYFLTDAQGKGHWDFFRPNAHMVICIVDAAYAEDTWIGIDGENSFKIRLLLSGNLLTDAGKTLIKGPQAHLQVSAENGGGGYFIAGGQDTVMVVIHCRTAVLHTILGIESADVPQPLDNLFSEGTKIFSGGLALTPKLARAAQQILDTRLEMPRHLHMPMIEAVGVEILCMVVAHFANHQQVKQSSLRLTTRDINCLYQARDYLVDHYANPPKIVDLARIAGVNQTKLKAGFKEVFGQTIYEFVLKLRMENAAELLLKSDHSISEVAYRVGYEYPANFSGAFRQYYGVSPKHWQLRQSEHDSQSTEHDD